jgi:ABC-type nitrate/sulfonate/bicarbonate transport system substrate-binding protein
MHPVLKHFFIILMTVLSTASATPATAAPVRLGWQVPWATQGQLVMGLTRTNIPALTGVQIEPVGFSYGAPLNSAALAGEVDVLLTADQPALVLLSKTDRFAIVARMMYNRVCIYVPPSSKIRGLRELKGRQVLGPVGAAAERVALAAVQQAGVPMADVTWGNLDMAGQTALLKRGAEGGSWPGADALYGFDPLPAVFEEAGQARMLSCGNVVSLVLASRDMIEKRPQELQAFLRAFALSWNFFATQPKLANRWFAEEARLDVSDAVLDKCAAVEPNRKAKTVGDLRLTLNDADYKSLAATVAFLRARELVREPLDVRKRVDLRPLQAALKGNLAALAKQVRPK